ncbi:hypothetical protein ACHWQZ_G012453 [Mnemiopsis leidyi]
MSNDLDSYDDVAQWDLNLPDGKHSVRFQHGTTSGRRVILVDGKEVRNTGWQFKLVGKESFLIGKHRACIIIEANGLNYTYILEVDGKSLKRFVENRKKACRTWTPHVGGNPHRVVLEKDSLNVWLDGVKLDVMGEFTDNGTETHFMIDNHEAVIRAVTSGKRREGIIYSLFIGDTQVPDAFENDNL